MMGPGAALQHWWNELRMIWCVEFVQMYFLGQSKNVVILQVAEL